MLDKFHDYLQILLEVERTKSMIVIFVHRFGSLLACETFHADVHAGNLWLLRDGRIGFLDFGMIF